MMMAFKASRMASIAWLSALLLSSGCTAESIAGAGVQEMPREQIRLSNAVLGFVLPSLKASRDFPSPRVVREMDLTQVTKPRILVNGYWDGPTRQLISAVGTMRIWLDVRPWPAGGTSTPAPLCMAKAKAFVDKKMQKEWERFRSGAYRKEPRFEVEPKRIAGRDSLEYRTSYDPNTVTYVIPFDGEFALILMVESAGNADPSAGWQAIFDRERIAFIESLQLSGRDAACEPSH